MEGKQALENISVKFDEMGFVPTTCCPNKEKHFIEWFNIEITKILKDLDKLDKVKVIIKLIKEKIENARLDYQRCFEEIDVPLCKSDDLRGQILAYQDVLFMLERIFNK